MRRCVLLVALVFAFSLFCTVGPAQAASDDDIPGDPLALASAVSQSVSSGDVNDVYAVTLTAGQEVHIRCDPGPRAGRRAPSTCLSRGLLLSPTQPTTGR